MDVNAALPLPLRVLVVDDQPMQRLVVRRALMKLGHQVFEAADGHEALALVARHDIELVVSDWLMDGMDGTELCRALRARSGARYVYFILMSSRDSREDLIAGLDAGADDFLRKPVDVDEFAVRLRSGQRLLALQAGLEDRNRRLEEAYGRIQRDVDAAGAFQKSLLPRESIDDRSTRFAWLFLPSRLVSGDALNYFRLDEHHIGFYHFDVAGHGVASAMVAMIVAQMLSPRFSACLVPGTADAARGGIASPAEVVRALNAHIQQAGFGANYLTCVYGVLDQRSGRVRLVRAGHTLPLVVERDGTVRAIDDDGDLPVGLFDDVDYHDIELTLSPGARLCIYSDGVTECEDAASTQYGLERLEDFFRRAAPHPAPGLVRDFEAEIRRWAGGETADFQDDISMLLIEHVHGTGPLPAP